MEVHVQQNQVAYRCCDQLYVRFLPKQICLEMVEPLATAVCIDVVHAGMPLPAVESDAPISDKGLCVQA